jgi:hypothetical protein
LQSKLVDARSMVHCSYGQLWRRRVRKRPTKVQEDGILSV